MVNSNGKFPYGSRGLPLVKEKITKILHKSKRRNMKNNSCCSNSTLTQESDVIESPQQLAIVWFDYVKMFFNWLFLFRKKPYTVKPGLYFTGEKYDKNAPLLVTCNFLSTVVLLYRRLKAINLRLLIVDTNGINVWCSSGKGRFSAEEILSKLNKYDRKTVSDSGEIELILPKLSLSGVKLSKLRKDGIRPIIGPVYAKELKHYLELPPYEDCATDTVHFGFKARAYTVVPTVVQFSKYAILMGLFIFILNNIFKTGFHWQVMPITIAISLVYPILFPWLPGKRFAIKGVSLALLFSLYTVYLFTLGRISLSLMIFYIAFIFGTSIFLALSYTGNSSVSNYSKVKKEIASFLPLSALSYVVAIVFYFINGSYK